MVTVVCADALYTLEAGGVHRCGGIDDHRQPLYECTHGVEGVVFCRLFGKLSGET